MAGFPRQGVSLKSAMTLKNSPVPLPCLLAVINNQGPGRNKLGGKLCLLPKDRREAEDNTM